MDFAVLPGSLQRHFKLYQTTNQLATVESNRKALINFYFCLNDFSEEIETTCGICIINIILMRLLSVYPVDISSIE